MKVSVMSIVERIVELAKEYSSDGAEYYYDEGYLRAVSDHSQGKPPSNEPDRDQLVPTIYYNDYKKGYDDGYEEFPDF
jgi:hypothetical protein